jgi:thiamine-phosphate pyrophosphorylase
MKIYAITRRQLTPGRDLAPMVRSWAEAGVEMAQVREKDLPVREVYDLVRRILEPPLPRGFELFVNERFDVALAAGAHGVHLGVASLPVSVVRRKVGRRLRIGYSAHSVREAVEAARAGADVVTLGPVFRTLSKPMSGPPLGIEPLREAVRRVRGAEVFALGGIDESSARKLRGAGVAGVALIAALMRSEDPSATVRALRRALSGDAS